MGNGRRFFDLGHEEGALADQLAGFADVLGALHERQGHPVHAQLQAESQVAAVLGRQRAQGQHGLGHVDALAIGQFAAIKHFGVDGVVMLGGYAQAQPTVVHQQVHARLQGCDDFRVRQVDPASIAGRGVEVQTQGLAAHQLYLAFGELADPQLRPLQVHEDAQRVVQLAFDFADPLVTHGVVAVLAVAEVQAKDVHPGFDQLTDVIDAAGGRAERREDFYFFVRRHVWGSRGSGWRGNR
ncbi:hypothetical protein D3C76_764660 [compost metagenome]